MIDPSLSNHPFDTNAFFSGGAGLFIQYHDIIKPVWLYAIIKMLMSDITFDLPIEIIKNLSPLSLLEWYIKRRYANPLKCLDIEHIGNDMWYNDMMHELLMNDSSLYRLSPSMNVCKMISLYRDQHFTFPIYVYSSEEEPFIKEDCKANFPSVPINYVYGDLAKCIGQCDQNFTYIFSDIETVKSVADMLLGSCSHVILARDYRYNYKDNCHTFKYDLAQLASSHPYIRMSISQMIDFPAIVKSLSDVKLRR